MAKIYSQEKDYTSFCAALPNLLEEHRGEVAVFHNQELVRCCPNMSEAVHFGTEQFGEERFIAQTIEPETSTPVSFSLAV